MHEHSMIKRIVEKIEDTARTNNSESVKSIKIWLGAHSHTTPEHFREHFDPLSKGTVAENAELEFVVSEDTDHPNAQDIVLESIKIEG